MIITRASSHPREVVDKVLDTQRFDTPIKQAREIIAKLCDPLNTPHILHLKIMGMWWNAEYDNRAPKRTSNDYRRDKISEMIGNRFLSGYIVQKAEPLRFAERSGLMKLSQILQDASYNKTELRSKLGQLQNGCRTLPGYDEVRKE